MLNFAHYQKTTARLGYGQTAEMADTQPVTTTQITTVLRGGLCGSLSRQAIAPEVHADIGPKVPSSRPIRFIENTFMAHAA